jgi:hypothetical protein
VRDGRLVISAIPSFPGETGPRTRSRGLRSAYYSLRGSLPRPKLCHAKVSAGGALRPFRAFLGFGRNRYPGNALGNRGARRIIAAQRANRSRQCHT